MVMTRCCCWCCHAPKKEGHLCQTYEVALVIVGCDRSSEWLLFLFGNTKWQIGTSTIRNRWPSSSSLSIIMPAIFTSSLSGSRIASRKGSANMLSYRTQVKLGMAGKKESLQRRGSHQRQSSSSTSSTPSESSDCIIPPSGMVSRESDIWGHFVDLWVQYRKLRKHRYLLLWLCYYNPIAIIFEPYLRTQQTVLMLQIRSRTIQCNEAAPTYYAGHELPSSTNSYNRKRSKAYEKRGIPTTAPHFIVTNAIANAAVLTTLRNILFMLGLV